VASARQVPSAARRVSTTMGRSRSMENQANLTSVGPARDHALTCRTIGTEVLATQGRRDQAKREQHQRADFGGHLGLSGPALDTKRSGKSSRATPIRLSAMP
jgi:hypothetical protein